MDLHELELLSNSVLDLVEAGSYDAAELVCREVSRRWPEQLHGIEGMAIVHEARGENNQAIECLETCIARDRMAVDWGGGETDDWYSEWIERLRARTRE